MKLEDFKKHLVFFFVSSFPVSILVYYLQHLYLILVNHLPPLNVINRFPYGDIVIVLGVFVGFYGIIQIERFLQNTFNIKNYFAVAFISASILGTIFTVYELILGLSFIQIFGQVPWNYESFRYNYKGIIALGISFVWTLAVFIFYLFLYKPIKHFKAFCDIHIYPHVNEKKIIIVLPFCFWLAIIVDQTTSLIKMYYFVKDPQNKNKKYLCYPEQREVRKCYDRILYNK